MTRKHFIKLADAIAGIEDAEQRLRTADIIGEVCQGENSLFNWAIWDKACDVDGLR